MECRFNSEKNDKLSAERGVNFDTIVKEIHQGNLLGITNNPNTTAYPNQKMMHVKIADQVYVVPYVVEKDGAFFLKTLYPSRKITKQYLGKNNTDSNTNSDINDT